MRKLICKLTGGHRYSDVNLQVHSDKTRHVFRIRNRCLKCGEAVEWEVPEEKVLPPVVRNPLRVDVEVT